MNRVQCGAARNKVRRRIQEHLDGLGLNMASLGRKIGVARQTVYATIVGEKSSRKVLYALKELGVPEKLLFIPEVRAGAENHEEAA